MHLNWESVPETLVVGIIVLVLLSIYRKRQSACTWNWIAGWIFVDVHFLCEALMPASPGLGLSLLQIFSLSSLLVSGVLFFLATIELSADSRTQRLMVLGSVGPFLIYIVIFVLSPSPMLLAAAVAAEFAALLMLWLCFFRRWELYCVALLIDAALTSALSFYSALHGELEYPIIIGLTGIYCFVALSYWHRFRRPSVGVILAAMGFLAWGSVFTFAVVLDFLRPGLIPSSSGMWNIPKYFVAGAMILTLLEEEIISAKRLMRRYQLQFDRSLCGVYRCTADGQMLECNDAFVRIVERGREEIFNTNIDILLAGSNDSGNALLDQLAKQSQIMDMEFAIATASGAPRYLIGNASLVSNSPGNLSEIEGTLLDITDFKSLQDQIRDSQKLEALGRLAGGVAHDFNNLLMVISGHMELLEDDLGSHPQSRARLDAVKNATKRGAAITSQLLAFSRKRPTEPRLLDMNTLIRDARTLLLPILGERITLEMKRIETGCDVLADENQMILVLMNMVINARDAMPRGGRVVLEGSIVDMDESLARACGLASPGQYVCIAVSDTGCGIPDDVKARIFEPFYTTKPLGKGTGLGLSICYGIIQQHHGTITVASSTGIGTTMCFYLPRVTSDASPAIESRSCAPVAKNARILVVDDEEVLRDVACEFFNQAGFLTSKASSSDEALRIFDKEDFDLVITDMVMPGMNGKQLGDELKKRAPHLPIIYISGYAQGILENQGQLAPGDILLQKPYSLQKLAHLVGAELEKRSSSAVQ